MGVLMCERHGIEGISIVCEHGEQGITTGKMPVPMLKLRSYLGNFLGEPGMPINIGLDYCLACAEKYSLPQEDKEVSSSEYFSIPGIGRHVCYACYMEAMGKTLTHLAT